MAESAQVMDLGQLIEQGETIRWRGKKSKLIYKFGEIFNCGNAFVIAFFIMSLLNWFYNGYDVSNLTKDTIISLVVLGVSVLFLWGAINRVLSSNTSYSNQEYIITDKYVYEFSGLTQVDRKRISFNDIKKVTTRRVMFSNIGDVILKAKRAFYVYDVLHDGEERSSEEFCDTDEPDNFEDEIIIRGIEDYNIVYDLIRQIQQEKPLESNVSAEL